MNKLHVALTLLKLISEYRSLDSKLVAEKLDVSIRTAQRYLEELAAMPFILHDHANHKYSLAPEHKVESNYLHDSQSAFISAMLGYTMRILGNDTFIKSVLERFNKNLLGIKPLVVQTATESFDKELYEVLAMYINMKSTISFRYTRYDKTYTVVPLRLIFADGYFYLAALQVDSMEVKKFSMSFITDVAIISSYTDIDLSVYDIQLMENIWENSISVKVLMRISTEVEDFFIRRTIFRKQEILHKDASSFLLQCEVSNDAELILKVLPWANHISILEPIEYRNEYLNIVKRAVELNEMN